MPRLCIRDAAAVLQARFFYYMYSIAFRLPLIFAEIQASVRRHKDDSQKIYKGDPISFGPSSMAQHFGENAMMTGDIRLQAGET